MKPKILFLPAFATIALLFVVPQALLVRDAWSGAAFARLLDPLYGEILARSVGLAAATTVATLLVGFPTAWALAHAVPRRYRGPALLLVTLPLWTSVLVKLYAWVFLLRSGGLLSQLAGLFSLESPSLLYTSAAVAIGQLYVELPYMILPIYASLERLDPSLLDAASDLGASPWETLRRVILPLAAPGMIAGSVLVFVPSLGSVLAPDLLGGAKTAWLGTLIANQFGSARDPAFGAALALALSAFTLAAFVPFRRALAKAQE